MSLDLSTLNGGDIIRHDGHGAERLVVGILDGVVVSRYVTGDGGGAGPLWGGELALWSVVVAPSPCPITEPVELTHTQNADIGEVWKLRAPITLYPEGQEPPAGAPRAFWTWKP